MQKVFFIMMIYIFFFTEKNIAQDLGGRYTYAFLKLPQSARLTSLGGELLTVVDKDVSLAAKNPALLNEKMHRAFSLSELFFMAGTGQSYLGYGYHLSEQAITLHSGLQYMHYGNFDGYDEQGQANGNFKANELNWTFGAGKKIGNKLRVGANVKWIASFLESYNSMGAAFDIAATYEDTSKSLNGSLVFRNIGTQFTTYGENSTYEALPFDILLSISKKLEHLPLRFSIVAHHLHQWDIRYDDPNLQTTSSFIGETEESNETPFVDGIDNFFRHFIGNAELLLGKNENLVIRIGYNHLLRAEMQAQNLYSMAGFSFGAGINTNRFNIHYGFGKYHIARAAHHLSIGMKL